jgi:hypothetical protein
LTVYRPVQSLGGRGTRKYKAEHGIDLLLGDGAAAIQQGAIE